MLLETRERPLTQSPPQRQSEIHPVFAFFKLAWKKWMQLGMVIGNFTSSVFLIIFYFTVFALFALPYRLFGKSITRRAPGTNWEPKKKTIELLDDFKYEY